MSNLICCRCKEEKNESEFSFKNKANNVRNKTCKECFKGVRKTWYIKHKESIIQKNISNKNKNVIWFMEYKKTLKCSKCGETHPACLDFHHIDSNEKDYDVSTIARSTYSISTIMKEIDKCVILCSNCHRKIHYNENYASVVQLDQSITFLK